MHCPQDCGYIIDELLHTHLRGARQGAATTRHIIGTHHRDRQGGRVHRRACATLIKRLAVDRLHIVGDMFDRGPRADIILDLLMAPPPRGYPVGQPRRGLDGRRCGQPHLRLRPCSRPRWPTTTTGCSKTATASTCAHLQRMAEQFYGDDDLSLWMPHTDAARGPYTAPVCLTAAP